MAATKAMIDTFANMGWALLFILTGGLIGIALVLASASVIPRLLDRLTPNLDEGKEIARGNQAVAEYFGRLVAAAIIGISLVIAAAVMGGILAALH